MQKASLIPVLLGCLLVATSCSSEGTDVSIGDIVLPEMTWGRHDLVFEVNNRANDIKFITVEIESQIDGGIGSTNRRTRSHWPMAPRSSWFVTPKLYIPPSYGTGYVAIKLYDVVDTMDAILPSQLVVEKRLPLEFPVPEAARGYLEPRVTMPPRVGEHPDFDNDLSRLLLMLAAEGKTVDEIAAITGAPVQTVKEMARTMSTRKYVSETDTGLVCDVPFITETEADEALVLADKVVDSLVTILSRTIPRLPSIRDRLVKAGDIPKDSNMFLGGARVLYNPYPLVGGLVLWHDLGQEFITRSAPLVIFEGTDPCNAYIPTYMYAVRGGPDRNGRHFFMVDRYRSSIGINFADHQPQIVCPEEFMLQAQTRRRVPWSISDQETKLAIPVDTGMVRPVLEALGGEADSLLARTYFELLDTAVKHGHEKLPFGPRYWFWNVVATRTLDRLVAQGVLTKPEFSVFEMSAVQGQWDQQKSRQSAGSRN